MFIFFILSCIFPISAVSCTSCSITTILVEVRTYISCASPSISWHCYCMTYVMSCRDSMDFFCSSGGAGGVTPYMVCTAVYPPFNTVVTERCCSQCTRWKNTLNAAHVLRSEGYLRHSLMLLLNTTVCARRVITFETTITSAMICPLVRTNSLPLSSCYMRRVRDSDEWYAPIIRTELSSSSISLISPKVL